MIKTIKHKGLERFCHSGNLSGIQAHHAKRLQLILTRLEAIISAEDMDLPGLKLHKLIGQLKGFYSVTVRLIGELFLDLKMNMHMMSIMLIIIKGELNV